MVQGIFAQKAIPAKYSDVFLPSGFGDDVVGVGNANDKKAH